MQKALEYGADVLEMDVHLTIDGELIVAHDSTGIRRAHTHSHTHALSEGRSEGRRYRDAHRCTDVASILGPSDDPSKFEWVHAHTRTHTNKQISICVCEHAHTHTRSHAHARTRTRTRTARYHWVSTQLVVM